MSEKLDKLRATLKKEQERRIKLNNRIVCFDIKQLGKQLKKLGIRLLGLQPERL